INSPLLSHERMVARARSVALLSDHSPGESEAGLPDLRFELFAGAAHHAIGEEMQQRDCTPGSIRDRFAALVGMFEPAHASSAA
ncbi:MAG TPA: hypothetical protein VI111_01925, partial [Thermoleophilaceae bacterium]